MYTLHYNIYSVCEYIILDSDCSNECVLVYNDELFCYARRRILQSNISNVAKIYKNDITILLFYNLYDDFGKSWSKIP